MAISQKRSLIRPTGKTVQEHRKKVKHALGRLPVHTKVGEKKAKVIKTIGGNNKVKLLNADTLNLYDPKTKKHAKINIKSVLENPANRNFVRRNIITRGTVVETEKGKARITSRPGQQGSVDAVLLK